MKHRRIVLTSIALTASAVWMAGVLTAQSEGGGRFRGSLTVSANSLTFTATQNGTPPPAQTITVSASPRTSFTARSSVQNGGRNWLSISPSGSLTTNQTIRVSVNQAGLQVGTYQGTISLATSRSTRTVTVTLVVRRSSGSALAVSPASLSFNASGSTAPPSQSLSVTAASATSFTASVASGANWLSISPSGSLTTNRTLTISVTPGGLAAQTYNGSIALVAASGTVTVPVALVVASSGGGSGGGTGTPTGYKLIGWNDLGMHCFDGRDFSIFGVLPPYNTIHAHLIDANGALVVSPAGYTVTYEAITDPLTHTINTTSVGKSNFWQFAAALGFGALAPDVGLKGYAMPGALNTPQSMDFATADNTWLAEGIPVMPYADAPQAPYPVNYFPMMRLTAKDSTGATLATTDIVLPVSDEMTCSVCHASGSLSAAAQPSSGWVNNADPAKDVKLNILRKHDDRFKNTSLFQAAALLAGYSVTGLEATTSTKPILCDNCHASNALSKVGVSGVEPLTTAMHKLHAQQIDPATNQTLDSATTRQACYNCHPGPNTQCLRGAMGTLKTSTGANAIECQSCHGSMSNLAVATRKGWLDEPNCQSCHTGTATSNSGQIVYTSVFSSGTTVRAAADQTFATLPNTPVNGVSLYRYSSGHGGLQCEACHGSTHAIFPTPVVNDNVQSTALQGHEGMLSECTACHSSVPNTVTGGPHGLHPIGSTWVSRHQSVAESGGTAPCQACHGADYRGTILSKVQADRTLAGHTFPRGTIIGCYSCHNGPNGGD
jgi:hypothetical protein